MRRSTNKPSITGLVGSPAGNNMLFAPVDGFLISFTSGFACCAFAVPVYGHRAGKELGDRATRRKILFLAAFGHGSDLYRRKKWRTVYARRSRVNRWA